MNNAKILITGPTGQVAYPVALKLAETNEVWAAARFARTYKGIGKAWITKSLSTSKSEFEIVELLNGSSKFSNPLTVEEFNGKKNLIKGLLAKSGGMIDGVVALGDDDFPPHRGIVKDSEKPIFIFYRGNLSLLAAESNNIACCNRLAKSGSRDRGRREGPCRQNSRKWGSSS